MVVDDGDENELIEGGGQLAPPEKPAATSEILASSESFLSLLPQRYRVTFYGLEQVENSIGDVMSERLKYIPEDRRIPSSPVVAGPTLDALRFVIGEPVLRDLFANLLATSMDSITAHQAHPAFVEILRQMTPDEARIVRLFATTTTFPVLSLSVSDADGKGMVQVLLKNFCLLAYDAGCEFPDLAANYLDNLRRLGLIEVISSPLFNEHQYNPLLEHPTFRKWIERIESETDANPNIEKGFIQVTDLGKQFRNTCVLSKAESLSTSDDKPTHILNFTDY